MVPDEVEEVAGGLKGTIAVELGSSALGLLLGSL